MLDRGLFFLFFTFEPDLELARRLWLASEMVAATSLEIDRGGLPGTGHAAWGYLAWAGRHLVECARLVTGTEPGVQQNAISREDCTSLSELCLQSPIERYRLLRGEGGSQEVFRMVSHLYYLLALLLFDHGSLPEGQLQGYLQTMESAILVTLIPLCMVHPGPVSRNHELDLLAAAYLTVQDESLHADPDFPGDQWVPPQCDRAADVDGLTYHLPLAGPEHYYNARWIETRRAALQRCGTEARPELPSSEDLWAALTAPVEDEEAFLGLASAAVGAAAGGLTRSTLSTVRRLAEVSAEVHENNRWHLLLRAVWNNNRDDSLGDTAKWLITETLLGIYTYALVAMAEAAGHTEFVIPSFDRRSCRRMAWEWHSAESVFFMAYRTFWLNHVVMRMRAVLPGNLWEWAEHPGQPSWDLLQVLGGDERSRELLPQLLRHISEERAHPIGDRIVEVVPDGLLRKLYLHEPEDLDELVFAGALDEGWFCGSVSLNDGRCLASLLGSAELDYSPEQVSTARAAIATLVLGYYWDIVAPTKVSLSNYIRCESRVTFRARDSRGRLTDRRMPIVVYVPRTRNEDYPPDGPEVASPRRTVRGYSVDGFRRRLPSGHRPSAWAEMHAADDGVRLEDGFTYVRGHDRGDVSLEAGRIYRCRSVAELLTALEEIPSVSPSGEDTAP